MSHLVAKLGWVELNFGRSLGWLAKQWVATAQAGWWNIPDPCQQNPVRDQMGIDKGRYKNFISLQHSRLSPLLFLLLLFINCLQHNGVLVHKVPLLSGLLLHSISSSGSLTTVGVACMWPSDLFLLSWTLMYSIIGGGSRGPRADGHHAALLRL